MVPLTLLWLPILLSAVVVFFASFIIHTVLRYHSNDVRRLPADKEDELLETLRRLSLAPGDYAAPHAGSMAGMKDPAFIAKAARGPLVFFTTAPGAAPSMAPYLGQWFVYSVVVSLFSAYITGRAVGPGADYMTVFRFVGATTFIGYALALPQLSIWYRRSWGTTLRSMIDGLIYGLLTAGVFGWLWPR
jgi:hypothetical protein